MDAYKILDIIHNQDHDTLTRLSPFPCTTTEVHNSLPNQPIFTQDIPLNPTHKTWLRLYKPFNPPPNTKLPLLIYFHGGGFIIGTASNNMYHDLCTPMAIELPAVILSVDYRLSPESRLPKAYKDAVEALHWVQNQALDLNNESMLKGLVDFSKCYLMGTSAGGNIAYHAGLLTLSMDLQPLVIRGFIFNQPYFSSLQRSPSELRLADDQIFSLAMSDVMWELALPKGSDRDHEYCNPLVDGRYSDKIGLLGRCFLNARGGDILVDRQMEFVKMLEAKGVDVVTWYEEEGCHGMDVFSPEKAKTLFAALSEFISSEAIGSLDWKAGATVAELEGAKRKVDEEEEEEDEDEKIEKFYALIRSTRDLRNRLTNGSKEKAKKKVEELEKQPVWTPTFEWEDFMVMEKAALVRTPTPFKGEGTLGIEEEAVGNNSGLDLKLSL